MGTSLIFQLLYMTHLWCKTTILNWVGCFFLNKQFCKKGLSWRLHYLEIWSIKEMIQFIWLYQVQYHIKMNCSNGMLEQRFILWILSRDYSSPYIHFLWTQLSSTIHQFNPEQNKNLLMNIVYFMELSTKKRKTNSF